MKYRVLVFVGRDLSALEDAYNPALTFNGLSWDEAVELCRLAFLQGYGCVLWQNEEVDADG